MDSQQFYEARASDKYVTTSNPHSAVLVKRIGDWLDIKSSDAVLDVGCCDGFILETLAKASPFARGVGIDISDAAVTAARQMARGIGSLEFVQASCLSIPFADRTFDKVIVNELIEHIANDGAALREIARICKAGALVYITAPNALHDTVPIFRSFLRRVDRIEGHLHRYATEEFRALATTAGFAVRKLTYSGFIASFLWQNFIIYNLPLKRFAMRMIVSNPHAIADADVLRPQFNGLSRIPFALMRLTSVLDAPFEKSRACMGFHALLERT